MIRYWDEKFWGKIVKPTSSLIPNIFRYPKPFETLPLRNDTVDKTILVENRNTRPLSYPERFSIPEINETLKNSPTKIFSTVRQKKSSETLDAPPPPSYPWTYSLSENFWNTSQKGSPTNLFDTVRQQIFYRKSCYSPPKKSFFDTRNFQKHRSVPLRKDSVLQDINFWQKIVILPPCLIPNIFRKPKFMKH